MTDIQPEPRPPRADLELTDPRDVAPIDEWGHAQLQAAPLIKQDPPGGH